MIKCYILSNLRSNAYYNHTILLECFTHGAEQSGQNVADTSLRYLLVPPSHFLFSLGYLATCNTLSGMVGTYSCWLIDKILHELKIVCHFKTVLVHYPNWSRGSYSSTLRNDIYYIYITPCIFSQAAHEFHGEEICREAAANAEDATQKPQPVPEGWTPSELQADLHS